MSIEESIKIAVREALAPLEAKLMNIETAVCFKPDTTMLSDEEAATVKGVSVSTLRRMKYDGRVGSVLTPKGRMCRACDLGGE